MLTGKIHRATVTEANVDYEGSVTIDATLMEAAGIIEFEQVLIADVNNGNRLSTYAVAGEPGSGVICMNGGSARLVSVGHIVIILAFAGMTDEEAKELKPKLVYVNERNQIVRTGHKVPLPAAN